MKNIKRILGAALAMVMLLSVLLTGCSVPKIAYNKIPDTAATYGDNQTLTSGEYLAYLYLEFENMYYNQGLYQYEYYGMDPWAQSFPYGESEEKLALSDYIIRATQDNIKRQIVLSQMLKDNGLKWFAEDEKDVDDSLKNMEADAYLPLGFNNDSYVYALKNANLNERSLFYGLYGENGPRAIAEKTIKEYFEKNYVSYKMISISLTDKDGKALDEKGEEYKKIVERMEKYEKLYKEKGFDAVKEQYDADEKAASSSSTTTTTTGTGSATGTGTTTGTTAAPTTTTTTAAPTTTTTTADEHEGHDHEKEEEDKDPNRVDADGSSMDEELVKVIKGTEKDGKVEGGIEIGAGKGQVVTYKSGGSTPTIALIERLDIHTDRNGKEDGLYEDSVENIIYELKYEEFDKEVDAAVEKLSIVFNEKVIAKCKPEDFLTIINNM